MRLRTADGWMEKMYLIIGQVMPVSPGADEGDVFDSTLAISSVVSG